MDINNYFEHYSAEEMLAALPRNYTKEMALYNNDIVDDQLEDYNFERLDQFIENVNLGIPDTVRITKFGIDGPPVTVVLQYDGNIIKYTADTTRVEAVPNYFTFYGYKIYTDILQRYGMVFRTYNLIEFDNKVFQFVSKIIQR